MHKVALVGVALACLANTGMADNCHKSNAGGVKTTLTPAMIESIMTIHAHAREDVAKNGGADVSVMHWSSKLAQLAENLNNGKCKFAHSTNACRSGQADFANVGENLAATSPGATILADVTKMTNMWLAEKKDYNANTGNCNGVCGHYTQMIWPSTVAVGCALYKCQSGILGMASYDLTCEYGPAGNWGGELAVHAGSGECKQANVCGADGHGRCMLSASKGHTCACEDGYKNQGNDEKAPCVKTGGSNSGNKCAGVNCHNHGSCNGQTGKCACTVEWEGDDCNTLSRQCNNNNQCNYPKGTCGSNHLCSCANGYGGLTCNLVNDPCKSGYCHHGSTCSVVNNAAKCACDASKWSGPQCDDPVGGAWTPVGMWQLIASEIHTARKNRGMADFVWSKTDVDAAQATANTCPKYSANEAASSNGIHHWRYSICNVPVPTDAAWQGSNSGYTKWLAAQIISKSSFATSRWTTRGGCALTNLAGACTGMCNPTYRTIECAFEVAPGHEMAEDNIVQTTSFPAATASPAGSVVVPVLAAVVVALAAVVVVLAAKLRRSNTVETTYTEMA